MTIWYDFTTSRRNVSRNGIANVEWRIGQALFDRIEHARAFELTVRAELLEIDPRADLVDVMYALPARVTTALPDIDRPGRRQMLRSGLESTLGRHAEAAEEVLVDVHMWLRRARAAIRRLPRIPRRHTIAQGAVGRRVRPDDVVVSMGADWSGELAAALATLKRETGCRVVTMVYDLIPLTHTHLAFHTDPVLFDRYYTALIGLSDLITCISEQTRHDLAAFAQRRGIALPRTAVLALGDGTTPPGDETAAERADYFLVVGTVERRKNVELIYDALRILESRGRPLPTVVVAGSIGWGVDDFIAEVSQHTTAASRSMVFLGSVDDPELDRLYSRARALLFPSHYEGWGLPVREAAVRGCPIAAGDSPAVREAIGAYRGAVVLSPDDAEPWAAYLDSVPTPFEPDTFRPWSTTVDDLLVLLDDPVRPGSWATR